ncbi:conjugal transfer protein TraB [Kitasatospora indigofera]|uniref:conjugal transfer protein TraB n=1 Tax=Kitasatospora indigofera TaxID=67307 RepID=UPI00368F5425
MTEIVPAAGGALTSPGGGGSNGFRSLAGRVTALATQALRLKEGMRQLQQHMARNASKASTLSEMCLQAEVDQVFVTQIAGVSEALHRVAKASGDLASSADEMEVSARGFRDAHQREYGGIHEAVNASPYRQPKPGFNRVR